MATPNLVAALGRQATELTATYTIPNSSPSGYIAQGSVLGFGPLVGTLSTVTVPLAEVWWIDDIYDVGGPQVVDGAVLIFVNGYMQNVQPTLSTININLITRFDLGQQIQLLPGVTFATSVSTFAAAPGSGGTTQIVKFKVFKEPYTG